MYFVPNYQQEAILSQTIEKTNLSQTIDEKLNYFIQNYQQEAKQFLSDPGIPGVRSMGPSVRL